MPGVTHPIWQDPAILDGSIAEDLPACRPFASSVFESDKRPAAVNDRGFWEEEPGSLFVFQYVVVLPDAVQAAAMLAGLHDVAFVTECLPASQAAVPTDHWTPVMSGQELTAPNIDVTADGLSVRRWIGTWSGGVTVDTPHELASAAVQIGRVVTIVNVALTD